MCCKYTRVRYIPALHRLEQRGWIQAKWVESENNRRAKYYSLTRDGSKYLRQQQRPRKMPAPPRCGRRAEWK